MKLETFNKLEKSLHGVNFDQLFTETTSLSPEDFQESKKFGLSFNVETGEIKFIDYITNEDKSWVMAYEQQNPCIIIGYVGANDIIMGDPAGEIIETLRNEVSA